MSHPQVQSPPKYFLTLIGIALGASRALTNFLEKKITSYCTSDLKVFSYFLCKKKKKSFHVTEWFEESSNNSHDLLETFSCSDASHLKNVTKDHGAKLLLWVKLPLSAREREASHLHPCDTSWFKFQQRARCLMCTLSYSLTETEPPAHSLMRGQGEPGEPAQLSPIIYSPTPHIEAPSQGMVVMSALLL